MTMEHKEFTFDMVSPMFAVCFTEGCPHMTFFPRPIFTMFTDRSHGRLPVLGTVGTTMWYYQYHTSVVPIPQCGTCTASYIDGKEADGVTVDYKAKYSQQLQSIKDNYKAFNLSYNGADNNDYVNGQVCPKDIVGCTRESANKFAFHSLARQFCCDDGTPEAAQARVWQEQRLPMVTSSRMESTKRCSSTTILTTWAAAETFSHEGYGHALIFVESGGDRNRAVHHFEGSRDKNLELVEKSISARKETIKNVEQ
jgi:hypothetical protein